jgi:hypothetical protein
MKNGRENAQDAIGAPRRRRHFRAAHSAMVQGALPRGVPESRDSPFSSWLDVWCFPASGCSLISQERPMPKGMRMSRKNGGKVRTSSRCFPHCSLWLFAPFCGYFRSLFLSSFDPASLARQILKTSSSLAPCLPPPRSGFRARASADGLEEYEAWEAWEASGADVGAVGGCGFPFLVWSPLRHRRLAKPRLRFRLADSSAGQWGVARIRPPFLSARRSRRRSRGRPGCCARRQRRGWAGNNS